MAFVEVKENDVIMLGLSLQEAQVVKTILGKFDDGTEVIKGIFEELDDAGVKVYGNLLVTAHAKDPVFRLETDGE